jgi:hypothetical protein
MACVSAAPPIELEREIACPRLHAFEVFTARTANWWPRELSRSGMTQFTVALEPWVGGRMYERTSEGDEFDWAEVTAWEPPRRIGFLWHLHGSRDDSTHAEVSFEAEGGSTVVRLVHDGFDRIGAGREELWQRSRGDWELALERFAAGCLVEPRDHPVEEER